MMKHSQKMILIPENNLIIWKKLFASATINNSSHRDKNGPSDPVHTGPDSYGHHINLKSLKTSMTLKFVIILQN